MTSTFSASLGLAKGLLYGVARTIGPGGYLDGLLSGRFLMAFLASGLVLITRGFIFAFHIMVNEMLLKNLNINKIELIIEYLSWWIPRK